jgi:hypothetical protein
MSDHLTGTLGEGAEGNQQKAPGGYEKQRSPGLWSAGSPLQLFSTSFQGIMPGSLAE